MRKLIDGEVAIKNLERYKDLFAWDDGDRERAILTRVIKELQSMPSVKTREIECENCGKGYVIETGQILDIYEDEQNRIPYKD